MDDIYGAVKLLNLGTDTSGVYIGARLLQVRDKIIYAQDDIPDNEML